MHLHVISQSRLSATVRVEEFETNTHMPVPELHPERTKSFEIGTNAKLFDGHVGLDFTYYKSNTYNQTFEAKASASSGYSTFYIQAGDIANWGY